MEDKFADLMSELNSLLEVMRDEGITKEEILKEVDNIYG